MIEFKLETAAAGTEGAPPVSIVGIGGAGANVLDHIALEGMDGVELVSMNCDVRSLTSSMAQRKVQLGKSLTQGLGCGGDPELGEEAAQSSLEEIREALSGRRMIFLCAGLGGGTGSGAAPVIARIARETGAFVIVFATMPFVFEGKRRMQQARTALEEIRRHANALVCFENDKMGELVLPKKGIAEAFEVADRIICQSVRAVTSVATQPGLIRIGMDDLVTALRNADSRCLFGFGQAKGEARATEALQAALKSPLLDRGQLLEKARNVLVHICGGMSLTLFEIETLMRDLTKHVSEDAQILFGAAADARLGDSLSVTIISSLGGGKAEAPAAVEKAVAAPPKPAAPAAPFVSAPPVPAQLPVPVLSVQPRQVPQPPPSSEVAAPPATMTITSFTLPALRLNAQLTPVKPPRPARAVQPPEPDLFAAPVTPAPASDPVPAEPVVSKAAAPAAAAPVAAPVQPLPAAPAPASRVEEPEVTNGFARVEETPVRRNGSHAAPAPASPVFQEEVEEAQEIDDEAPETLEEPEAEEVMAEDPRYAEAEEEPVYEPVAAAEEEDELEVRYAAESEVVGEEEEVIAAEEIVEIEDLEEPEQEVERYPARPSATAPRPAAPLRSMEAPQPVAKSPAQAPAPARKFDLREILQRQRQTRLGHLRSVSGTMEEEEAVRSQAPPAPARPGLQTPRPAAPAARPVPAPAVRQTPASRPSPAPAQRVADRTPDPSRVTPIRPIPAGRAGSPFVTVRPGHAPGSNGGTATHAEPSRQGNFDERLSPSPASRGARFEKAEPTLEEGEDLDIPTFLRKKR